jgi:hypothetical protein
LDVSDINHPKGKRSVCAVRATSNNLRTDDITKENRFRKTYLKNRVQSNSCSPDKTEAVGAEEKLHACYRPTSPESAKYAATRQFLTSIPKCFPEPKPVPKFRTKFLPSKYREDDFNQWGTLEMAVQGSFQNSSISLKSVVAAQTAFENSLLFSKTVNSIGSKPQIKYSKPQHAKRRAFDIAMVRALT